ncbi:NAD(P)/FAD-dependent oxidoreductase [Sanguibacter sp. 25GB23B1]|uniref:flavin-containing monooxygenase n=1 Tax=unclassified Sanguibacter TaxID=2645534 RepID=UPI0032AE994F
MTSSSPVIIVGAGQSGLAAAAAVRSAGLDPLVLEAGASPTGSWPGYYDTLRLFSPARYSALPGLPFGGDPDRYPTRDEVVEYLERYAEHVGAQIRTGTRVESVEQDGPEFTVRTTDGQELPATGLIAASGSFGSPVLPAVRGLESFTGQVLHSAAYRSHLDFVDKQVIVVGGGNSAVQIAHELTTVARVRLASRSPITFAAQRRAGRDLHHWFKVTGFDVLPTPWIRRLMTKPLVLDTGTYRTAIASGALDRRDMFTELTGNEVVWSNGSREQVDAVIFATGFRPALDYLDTLGALDGQGSPVHRGGISTTHAGLGYVGLELQRSFSSNTLRGVGRDAAHVATTLATHVRGRRRR